MCWYDEYALYQPILLWFTCFGTMWNVYRCSQYVAVPGFFICDNECLLMLYPICVSCAFFFFHNSFVLNSILVTPSQLMNFIDEYQGSQLTVEIIWQNGRPVALATRFCCHLFSYVKCTVPEFCRFRFRMVSERKCELYIQIFVYMQLPNTFYDPPELHLT